MGQLAPNLRVGRKVWMLTNQNEQIDILYHRWVATGTCEHKRIQDNGSRQADRYLRSQLYRYIIMDVITIQQVVDSATRCSAMAI